MRPLRDLLKDFLTTPLGYWFGASEPFEYEISDGRIFEVSASRRRRLLVLSEIRGWRRNNHDNTISVYEADSALIMWDGSDKLGAILEKELPECWIIEDE